MVDKNILKELKKIKRIKDKIGYIESLILLKNPVERIRFLNELASELREDELKKIIEIMIVELKSPTDVKEDKFPVIEEEREKVTEKPEARRGGLKGFFGMEEEKKEAPKEYFITPSAFYESTMVESIPLIMNIKRELERKGLLKEGTPMTDGQRLMIMEEVEKYSPNLSPERVKNYVDLLSDGQEKYKIEFASTNIREMLESESKKEIKYVKKLEAK